MFSKLQKAIILGLICVVSQLFADIPNGYYDDATGLTGETLKDALHSIIDNHTMCSYDTAKEILKKSDEDPDNSDNVILLYTGRSQAKSSFGSGVNNWNREHVWAKSHGDFGTSNGPGSDAHHLRPTDASVNSDRSALDFDNGGNQHSEATGCFYDSDSWEPRDAVKGDVARMVFYMATRYESEDGYDLEVADNVNTGTAPLLGKLSTLLEWNNQDPVDDFERNRNEVVFGYQHNRNPFIDHPEFVSKIWGGNAAEPLINFVNTSLSVNEEDGNILIPITISKEIQSDITIGFTFSGTGSQEDYTCASSLTFPANTTDNQNAILTLIDDELSEDLESVIITISSLSNDEALIGNNSQFTLNINTNDGFDNTKPTISSTEVINSSVVVVSFSEEIEKNSSEIEENYSLNGEEIPLLAVKLEDNSSEESKVILVFDSLIANTNYTLTVNNIKDLAENSIEANTTSTFIMLSGGDHFVEGFENADSWTSYTTGIVNFDSGAWEFNQVYPETDMQYEGSFGARINDDKPEASIITPSLNGVGIITFYYNALHDETSLSTFKVQKSIDNAPFIDIIEQTYDSEIPAEFTCAVNDASDNIRIRILNDNQPGHLVIDQVKITSLVQDDNLVANFIATDKSPDYTKTIQFIDYSLGNPVTWAWDFDNDGVVDSYERHPSFEYSTNGTYTVKLTITNSDGVINSIVKDDFITIQTTSVVEDIKIDDFKLNQNYPNPFNPVTNISFNLNKNVKVNLTVYNAFGQFVKELTNQNFNSGSHSIKFDATNFNSGIYFYRLRAGNEILTKKMIFCK